jgi:hypothetical protein
VSLPLPQRVADTSRNRRRRRCWEVRNLSNDKSDGLRVPSVSTHRACLKPSRAGDVQINLSRGPTPLVQDELNPSFNISSIPGGEDATRHFLNFRGTEIAYNTYGASNYVGIFAMHHGDPVIISVDAFRQP